MASSGDIRCSICDVRYLGKLADCWCPECKEGLCLACQEHHSISKASKNHEVISIENYTKLPKFVTEIAIDCPEHILKFQLFCPHHEQLCCPVCVATEHKKCVDLIAVSDLIKQSKTSPLLGNMAQSINDLENNLRKVIQDREQNLEAIRKQCKKLHDEIREARVKVNSHFDFLEQQVIHELNTAEQKVTSEIEILLAKLSRELNAVVDLQDQLIAINEYASNLQTFFGVRAIEPEIEKEEKIIKSLHEDGSLKHVFLRYSIDHRVLDILKSVTAFGSISIQKRLPSFVLKLSISKQAQIMSAMPMRQDSINDIVLTMQSTLKIPTGKRPTELNGCCICPDGKMVFVDTNNNRLVILNYDGSLYKEICISPFPYDVTCINDVILAVSTDDGILIINKDSEQTEQMIKTNNSCYGVAYDCGKLVWCEHLKGINMVELPDETPTTVVKQDTLPIHSYITTSDDKIYQTNHRPKTVTCYTMTGETLWEYKDESILCNLVGVTIDNDLNLYLTSDDSFSVVALSSDGQQITQLLDTTDDEIIKPRGIYFDKTKNNLIIVNLRGPAYLYKLS